MLSNGMMGNNIVDVGGWRSETRNRTRHGIRTGPDGRACVRARASPSERARERELLLQRAGWTWWTAHLAGKLNSDLKISASRSAGGDRSIARQ